MTENEPDSIYPPTPEAIERIAYELVASGHAEVSREEDGEPVFRITDAARRLLAEHRTQARDLRREQGGLE